MSQLVLSSNGGRIIDRALTVLILQNRPGWTISWAGEDRSLADFLRLELRPGGRWLAMLRHLKNGEGAAQALAQGASAVLPFDAELAQLEMALNALEIGSAPYIPGEIARLLANDIVSHAYNPERAAIGANSLTRRESEVLSLVAQGLSNREIAQALSVSVNTVRSHLQSLSVKLKASTRAKMVANAWQAGMSPRQPALSLGQEAAS